LDTFASGEEDVHQRPHSDLGVGGNRGGDQFPYYVMNKKTTFDEHNGIYSTVLQSKTGKGGLGKGFAERISKLIASSKGMLGTGNVAAVSSAGSFQISEELKRSVAKAELYVQQEQKLEAARQRRENALFLKQSSSRSANNKHADISRNALQRRWREDAERSQRSHTLKQSTDEQVVLRKVTIVAHNGDLGGLFTIF
jgi:hypothetical protein